MGIRFLDSATPLGGVEVVEPEILLVLPPPLVDELLLPPSSRSLDACRLSVVLLMAPVARVQTAVEVVPAAASGLGLGSEELPVLT